jgi:radical SAM superfamily enzyme YgiQ (UPF0313 family)
MADVLLINSIAPFSVTGLPNIPLGLAQLASCLEKEGIDVEILDLNAISFNRWKALRRTLASDPRVVGIYATSIDIHGAVSVARMVKACANSYVVIGGPHVKGDPNFINKFSDVFDYEVFGEGEISFIRLVKDILKGHAPKDRIITGIPVDDLESLPLPAYHLLDMKTYNRFGLVAISTRGCPFNCIYCAMGGTGIRFRRPESFVEELSILKNEYNAKRVYICDNNFTLNKSHARNICLGMIREKVDLSWMVQTRCDLIDRDTLNLARRSGCDTLQLGVESLSESTQRMIKKNLKLDSIERAVRLAKSANLKVWINLMIGLPSETREDMHKTVNMLKKLKPDFVGLGITTPFPGTELFNLAVRNGLDPNVWNKYANGEMPMIPICLNPEVGNLYYFRYFSEIFLNFPHLSHLGWTLTYFMKLLSPRMSSMIARGFRPIFPIVNIANKRLSSL